MTLDLVRSLKVLCPFQTPGHAKFHLMGQSTGIFHSSYASRVLLLFRACTPAPERLLLAIAILLYFWLFPAQAIKVLPGPTSGSVQFKPDAKFPSWYLLLVHRVPNRPLAEHGCSKGFYGPSWILLQEFTRPGS